MRTAPRSALHSFTRRSRSSAAIGPGASAAASLMRCESRAKLSRAVVISGVGIPSTGLSCASIVFLAAALLSYSRLSLFCGYSCFIIDMEDSQKYHGKDVGITITSHFVSKIKMMQWSSSKGAEDERG